MQGLCAVLAMAVYAPALEGPFVWDDRLLLETPQIAELRPLPEYFRQPFWQVSESNEEELGTKDGAYYRPLSTLSLAIDRSIHGENASGFHLLGLLLHGINTALVLSLARRLGATLPAAFVGALFFAWFPRLSESVAWISGRTDVLASTFSLLALRVTLGSWAGRQWMAAGCILLGALSKELALAAAVGVLFWEWSASRGLPVRSRWLRLLPTAVASAVYLGLRTWVLGVTSGHVAITGTTRALASLEAVARYAIMLVDGWQPRLQIGYLASPDPWLAALGGVLLLSLVGLFLLFRPVLGQRARAELEQTSLVLVFCVALGLVLHVVPISGKVVAADRFLYLPVAVLGVLLAVWISRASNWPPLAIGAALVVSYAPATWQRAQVWGDDITFWGTAVLEQKSSPLDAHSRLGFGNLLAEHGMYEEALRQYAQAQPGDAHSWMLCQYNRAGLLAMNGEFEAAIDVLRNAYHRAPNATQLRRLALLYASSMQEERAREVVPEYGARISDLREVQKLDGEVSKVLVLMPEVARPRVGLSDELAQARGYAEVGLFRVAMAKLTQLTGRPEVTPGHLQGMLTSALEHGTPEQVKAIFECLLVADPQQSPTFNELVDERLDRVGRLERWVERLEK